MLSLYELAVLRRYVDVATVCSTPGGDCTGCPDFRPGQECTSDNGLEALKALEILSKLLDQEEQRLDRAEVYACKASPRLLRALAAYCNRKQPLQLKGAAELSVGQIIALLLKGERTIQSQQSPNH